MKNYNDKAKIAAIMALGAATGLHVFGQNDDWKAGQFGKEVILTHAANVTYSAPLTTYAQGYSMDLAANSLASIIAPWVVTGRSAGQFISYEDKSLYAVYDTARAVGQARARIAFGVNQPYYNCKPHGLEIPTDDFEKEASGVTGPSFPLMQAKIRMLVNAAYRSREKRVWDYIKANKTATGGLGVWSNAAVSPIAQINGEIAGIAADTGVMPTDIVFSLSAWQAVVDHPMVVGRKTGVSQTGVSRSEFASLLLNPAIRIHVGMMPYDANPPGLAVSKTQILGAEVFIFVANQNPDEMDPSFAKSFSTYGRGVDKVVTYREQELTDIAAVDWSEDVQIVSPSSARRITVS